MAAEWDEVTLWALAEKISTRAKELEAAGEVQESPDEGMEPGERLAHLIAQKVARHKAQENSWQGTNIINARSRFVGAR